MTTMRHVLSRYAFCLLAAASAAGAQTYKCVDAQGAVSFQQLPCPGKSAEQNQVVVKDVPLLSGKTAIPAADSSVGNNPSLPEPSLAEPPQGPAMRECLDELGRPYFRPIDLPCGQPPQQHTPEEFANRAPPENMPPANSRVGRRIQNHIKGMPTAQPDPIPNMTGSSDDACARVKAEAEAQRAANRNMTFDQRRALDDRVYSVCKSL